MQHTSSELNLSLILNYEMIAAEMSFLLGRQSLAGGNLIYITFVAARMMRMMMISTITPIIIIILMFFHQYFLATRVDVFWNESA